MASAPTKIDISRETLRVLLLHEFRLGSSAREAADWINRTMGEDTVSAMTASRWFNRFRDGERAPRLSARCLEERLQCGHATVLRYLHALGETCKYGSWVPHELAPHQLQERFDLSVNNLRHHATDDALEHLVTGDEK